MPVVFFGGEEALAQRQELDLQKRRLCKENDVGLIEWPYDLEPTDKNITKVLRQVQEEGNHKSGILIF